MSSGHRKFSLEIGETLIGASSRYVIAQVLGEGSFGTVLECWDVDSHEKVAIKVLKMGIKNDTERELAMLKAISVVDPDQNHLVKFLEIFEYMGHTCLVFEKLDINLFNLMVQEDMPMSLIEIRDVAEQLLVALDTLKGLALVHGDIKPDNIMLVNAEERPMNVKLVDFGLGIPVCKILPGMGLQALGFRAPEVSLGLQYNEAVDVWGLGCVLAFLYLNGNLFPLDSEYLMLKSIVQTLGQPPDHLLSEGGYTWRFFTKEEGDVNGSRWRLLTLEEFVEMNDEPAGEEDPCYYLPGGLDDLIEMYPVTDDIECKERAALVDFLKGLLDLDPEKRLTPQDALKHPFITRSYLSHDPVNQEPLDQEPLNQEAQSEEDSTSETTERKMKEAHMSSLHHSEPSVASGHREFSLETGDTLIGASSRYVIEQVLGEGGYGKVLECWNVDSHEKVAIKIFKRCIQDDTERELVMLKAISVVDPDQNHLVKFLEIFEYMGHTFLVFEKLDITLVNLILQEDSPMSLVEIRDVAEQLLVALDTLKGLALMHGDIKPDNIMLVNAEERPMNVKLVDFGLGVPVCKILPGMVVQALGFRAPEVSLGLQYNEAVDVWGLGCVLAFLYLNDILFSLDSEYLMMKSIVQTLGQPPDHLLSEGVYTWRFFTKEEGDVNGSRWRLLTPEEFVEMNDEPAGEEYSCFHPPGSLDDLMKIHPVTDDIEWKERAALVDFLKGLLDVDPEKRLTPQEALKHPFITRSYLSHDPVNQEPLDQEPLYQEAQSEEDSTSETTERTMKEAHMSSLHHSEPSVASGHREFSLETGDTLIGASSRYVIEQVLGEGGYGKVLECWNVDSHEKVAIKIFKRCIQDDTERELVMLKAISAVDPDQNHLVKFLEIFEYMGHTFLVFEKLDITLVNLILQEDSPMSLVEIRDVAEQLLVALDTLKGLALMHGDIKPDNIMLVNAEERPMNVKLVDFGLGVPVCKILPGMVVQALGFRAPEVSLGLQYNEAVDVWGLGCVLAFLYLNDILFSLDSEYLMMKSIVQTLGQPADHLLSEGGYTRRFFSEEEGDVDGSRWRLLTPEEFVEMNDEPAGEEYSCFHPPGSLDDLMKIYPVTDDIECKERAALVDFLKGLLDLDPEKRLTPQEALKHPFITRSYLSEYYLSHDPVNQEPLNQEAQGQEPLDQDPLNQEPLDQEPLNGPSQDQTSDNLPEASDPQDSDSGVSELSGPFRDVDTADPINIISVTEENVDVEEEDSGSSEECGPDEVPVVSTTTSRFKRFKKAMGRVFKTIRKTLCCCVHPEVDE